MCRPIVVRVSSSTSSASATSATTTATIVTLRISTPATVIARFSGVIDAATSPSWLLRRSTISAIAWSKKAIAKVVTSITAGDCPRSGRKTTRSIASESAITTAKQATIPAEIGQPDVNASVYAPAITSWPYAKFTRRSTPKTSPIPTAISA